MPEESPKQIEIFSMDSHDSHNPARSQIRWKLGVVSFLNARPLIFGLDRVPTIRLLFDVPSSLTGRLLNGEFDAALIPVIDIWEHRSSLRIVSDSCIGCDGETLTVRVLSQVPPADVRQIFVDSDSHTSIALAKILWPALFRRQLDFQNLTPRFQVGECEAVLLIGDKVVGVDPAQFRYQVDLGGAWKTWTGLPFVFAVWAARRDHDTGELSAQLATARDLGVKYAGRLAVEFGPAHGWPVSLAQEYLQRYLTFSLTEKHVEGMVRFFDHAQARSLSPRGEELQANS